MAEWVRLPPCAPQTGFIICGTYAFSSCQQTCRSALQCCHSDLLPPRGQRGWMWQKPGCPQSLPPNLSVLHLHTDSAPGHAFCLGSCLSQPTSQGLRLKGRSGKGVPRLCSPAPWLALPVLTVAAPTEQYAQPLLCPFILYTPTEQRGAPGFLHISLPEQHVLGLDWPYPTTLSASSPDPPSLSPQNLLREAAESTQHPV